MSFIVLMERRTLGFFQMIRVMDNKIFQEVFDILQSVLPPKWDKVCFFAGYTEGSYTMKYYTYNNGTYVDCFSQKEISRTQLIKGFMSIDKVLSTERKVLDEEHRWTVMTMIVSADGSMRSEFDYDDISENAIQYERDWERKYLN